MSDINPITGERDLTRTHELTFEQAMVLYEAGKRIRRRSTPNRYYYWSKDTANESWAVPFSESDRAADDWHVYEED